MNNINYMKYYFFFNNYENILSFNNFFLQIYPIPVAHIQRQLWKNFNIDLLKIIIVNVIFFLIDLAHFVFV